MFWRFGFHTQSAIDTLLEREEVTLEQVLEEEELIQECKTHNRKLLDFLCRDDVLEALLAYIIEKPEEGVEETMKYRYPCLAAEIFSCEVLSICDALMRNEHLLQEFWRYLDEPSPLNPIQASYFCRVIIVLMHKKTLEMVRFIRSQERPLQKMINHIETSAVTDMLTKLISCEEGKEGEGVLQWALDEGMVELLLEKFDPSLSPEIHGNAANTIIELLNLVHNFGTHNPIIEHLKSRENATKVFQLICQKDAPHLQSALVGALSVFIELIQRSLGFVQEGEMHDIDFKEEDLTDFLAVLEPNLAFFHEVMVNAKPSGVTQGLEESSPEKPLPLGALRLKIIEFFIIVLHINNPAINKRILELNIIPCYIDLMFKYQWNNFLHSFVHDLIVKIFSSDLEYGKELMSQVLKEGGLTEKIVKAAKDNEADVEQKKGMRRGYMGHVILISNHLSKYAELPGFPEDARQYFEQEHWKDYEKMILSETNMRDNKPLGGHRPIRSSESDEILHAGLHEGDSNDLYADDDEYEYDDGVIEKHGFSQGQFRGDYDDSDEEPESTSGDSWTATFESSGRGYDEMDLNGPKGYSTSSFD